MKECSKQVLIYCEGDYCYRIGYYAISIDPKESDFWQIDGIGNVSIAKVTYWMPILEFKMD